jgi:hypothetical protein
MVLCEGAVDLRCPARQGKQMLARRGVQVLGNSGSRTN